MITRKLIVLSYELDRITEAAARHGVTVAQVDEISEGLELEVTVTGNQTSVSALADELGFDQ